MLSHRPKTAQANCYLHLVDLNTLEVYISERSFDEGSEIMVNQKPKVLNQINDSLQ